MIKITKIDGTEITFKMKDQLDERDYVDQAKQLDESFQLNLGEKGKVKISDIQNICFELDERFLVAPNENKSTGSESSDILSDIRRKQTESKDIQAKAFIEAVKYKLGYVPHDHPLFAQFLETASTDSETKLPLYVNMFVNSIKGSAKRS